MKKIIIFAGTTEGRYLAQIFAENKIACDVCVATDYGEQVLDESEYITIRKGRLSVDEMKQLYQEAKYDAVIDATHPYATAVTENIFDSLKECKIPYYRVAREVQMEDVLGNQVFENTRNCVEALKATKGRIFLTTGSKELSLFCEDEDLKKRLIVRVLPGKESMEACYKHGLEGRQIIAMQGPFSKDLNQALLKQFEIAYLVTKNSGKVGGYDEKIQAANELAIPCYIIKPPKAGKIETVYSVSEICEAFSLRQPKPILNITLAGIGPGGKACMTDEVKQAISHADYLFGAKRMLSNLSGKKGNFPYYLKEDIAPCLERIQKEAQQEVNIVMLFSGDTGFFSGCEKLYAWLKEKEEVRLKVMPGISSLSCMAAKMGMNWQDAYIMSTHGIPEKVWKGRLDAVLKKHSKIFLLTSGKRDVQEIGQMLEGRKVEIHLGHQLSYKEEWVKKISAKECQQIQEDGLFVLMLSSKENMMQKITPGISDEMFLRDQVPMTKEDIRTLSICKLGLYPNAVVYDIGSGTGSIAIETAMLGEGIFVYAIETKELASQLIEKNCEKFGVKNVEVVRTSAPDGLEMLPIATHAVIGGSRGRLSEILEFLYKQNPTMRIVVHAVSLETISELQEVLKKFPIQNLEIDLVSVSKGKELGNYHLMQAQNPVYLYTFEFKE